MKQTRTYLDQLLTEGNPKSSRRFVTLVISGIFIITCLTVLFLLIALFISTVKLQGINVEALKLIIELLGDVLKYEFLIIVAGLFVTSVKGRAQLFNGEFIKNLFAGKNKSNSYEDYYTDQEIKQEPPYDPLSGGLQGGGKTP